MSQPGNDDKTEDASSRKLSKARQEGQIPRAKEFTTAITLLAFIVYFINAFPHFAERITGMFETGLRFDYASLQSFDAVENLARSMVGLLIDLFAPIIIVTLLTSVLASSILGGFMFNPKNIMPKFSKLNPKNGLKNMFSSKSLVELLKSILKISVLFYLLYWFLSNNLAYITSLQRSQFQAAAPLVFAALKTYAFYMIAVLIIYGLIDLPYQKYIFDKQMKMSKQELKEEHKQQEGNPQIKAKIRQLQRQMAMRAVPKVVPDADVVIMNPTHYAVAIKYDPKKAPSPYVLAKGTDELALYIQRIALDSGVEVVTSPPLARAVYHTTNIDQMIPSQLYTAMAHILSYVIQIRSFKQGKGMRPEKLPHFTMPQGFEF